MDVIDKVWDYLTKLPKILHEYSTYSYPFLIVLSVGGILILLVHFHRRHKGQEGLEGPLVIFGVLICFLSLSGFFLKGFGAFQEKIEREAFIAGHRVPQGEQWLLVFDFSLPAKITADTREQYYSRMKLLVGSMSEVLLEDLPQVFRQPRIVRIATAESPWRDGVGSHNFDQVIRELNASQIMWGDVLEKGDQAKAFLGISAQLTDLDPIIPLRNIAFNEDPRREHLFGDGYYRLLGLVTLGIALNTCHQARQASGEDRKSLFLQAVQQLSKAREIVNNRRDDPMLSRNLYSPKIDKLIQVALKESGVTP
jgi:hypothetical protein